MDVIIVPLLLLLKSIIGLMCWVVIADVLLGWLITLNILSTGNRFVVAVISMISRISEFILDPIRRKMPISMGMFDISPIVLILFLTFIENVINRILLKFM